jgi:hypothetical protein
MVIPHGCVTSFGGSELRRRGKTSVKAICAFRVWFFSDHLVMATTIAGTRSVRGSVQDRRVPVHHHSVFEMIA